MSDFSDNSTVSEKKRSKTPLIIILLILILSGGAAAAYFFLFADQSSDPLNFGSSSSKIASTNINRDALSLSIIPMDEIIINIRDRNIQRVFKLNISLELENSEDSESANALMPVLLDSFQSHLRSLRLNEIEGSRAIYRIKEELLSRADIVLNPIKVKNILFSEMLLM